MDAMNRSAEQTNCPLCASCNLSLMCSDSFPMNPEKKTLIPKLAGVVNVDQVICSLNIQTMPGIWESWSVEGPLKPLNKRPNADIGSSL